MLISVVSAVNAETSPIRESNGRTHDWDVQLVPKQRSEKETAASKNGATVLMRAVNFERSNYFAVAISGKRFV